MHSLTEANTLERDAGSLHSDRRNYGIDLQIKAPANDPFPLHIDALCSRCEISSRFSFMSEHKNLLFGEIDGN